MAHCDISFHTQMICLLHIAIMVRPLQELLMMVKAEQTKETATLLQAWIQKMFLFLTLWTEMANFSNIFGLYGLSKQYLSQISHFGSVLKEICRYDNWVAKGQLISKRRLASRRFSKKTNGQIWFVRREE